MTVTVDSTLVEKPIAFSVGSSGDVLNPGYRGVFSLSANVANAAGSGAGATVTVPFVFTAASNGVGLPTSLNYCVNITANQACATYWTSKTSTGFNVVLAPLVSSATLSSGTFDVTVTWTA